MRDLISTQRPVQRDDISDRRYAGRQSAGVSGARSPWLVMVGGRQATQHVAWIGEWILVVALTRDDERVDEEPVLLPDRGGPDSKRRFECLVVTGTTIV